MAGYLGRFLVRAEASAQVNFAAPIPAKCFSQNSFKTYAPIVCEL